MDNKNTFVDGWELLTMANLHISKNLPPNITFYSYYPLHIAAELETHNIYTINDYYDNELDVINEHDVINELDVINDTYERNVSNELSEVENYNDYDSCDSDSDDSDWSTV